MRMATAAIGPITAPAIQACDELISGAGVGVEVDVAADVVILVVIEKLDRDVTVD